MPPKMGLSFQAVANLWCDPERVPSPASCLGFSSKCCQCPATQHPLEAPCPYVLAVSTHQGFSALTLSTFVAEETFVWELSCELEDIYQPPWPPGASSPFLPLHPRCDNRKRLQTLPGFPGGNIAPLGTTDLYVGVGSACGPSFISQTL